MDELLGTLLSHLKPFPSQPPYHALTPPEQFDGQDGPAPPPMGTTIPTEGTGIPSPTEHQSGAFPILSPPMAPHRHASPSGCCRSSGFAGGRGHCPRPPRHHQPGSPLQGASSPGAKHPQAERGGPAVGGSCLTPRGGSGAQWPLLGLLRFSWPSPTPC